MSAETTSTTGPSNQSVASVQTSDIRLRLAEAHGAIKLKEGGLAQWAGRSLCAIARYHGSDPSGTDRQTPDDPSRLAELGAAAWHADDYETLDAVGAKWIHLGKQVKRGGSDE